MLPIQMELFFICPSKQKTMEMFGPTVNNNKGEYNYM